MYISMETVFKQTHLNGSSGVSVSSWNQYEEASCRSFPDSTIWARNATNTSYIDKIRVGD